MTTSIVGPYMSSTKEYHTEKTWIVLDPLWEDVVLYKDMYSWNTDQKPLLLTRVVLKLRQSRTSSITPDTVVKGFVSEGRLNSQLYLTLIFVTVSEIPSTALFPTLLGEMLCRRFTLVCRGTVRHYTKRIGWGIHTWKLSNKRTYKIK